MTRICWVLPVFVSLSVQAQPWQFASPLAVTPGQQEGVFHHLESSGRRSLAVSESEVAVTWEDNRTGAPQVYLAHKPLAGDIFAPPVRISSGGEAYEPSVAALADGRFVVAWEQDAQVYARMLGSDRPLRLSKREGAQVSLQADGEGVVAVYAEREQRYARIRFQRLLASPDGTLSLTDDCPVDRVPPVDEQLYPTAALGAPGHAGRILVAAWEDRRPKHTIIMASVATSACRFTPPQRISLKSPGRGTRNLPYGAGHGVSRVALAGYGAAGVFAAWADKRNFRHGYDIWGAHLDADKLSFGANLRIQDDFGELAHQWHTSIAGHPDGTLVVAWDDDREGNADIMLSWRRDDAWSDDLPLPGGSGPGEQSDPSIVLDHAGNLHVVWVERERKGEPARLGYAVGHRNDGP